MGRYSIKVGRNLLKREKERGKLRLANGSWSINLGELPETVDHIIYITEKYRYSITREDAFAKGFIKSFQGETKLVVPITYWHKTKLH